MSNESRSLSFIEAGSKQGRTSICLIHGAFCSGTDWAKVIPLLQDEYHLVVPDLPGHGQSSHIQPFSQALAAELLAKLIQQHASNGRAHIMGMSLGVHITFELASKFPDVVLGVFASGFNKFPFKPAIGVKAMQLEQFSRSLVPTDLMTWIMDSDSYRRPSRQLLRQVVKGICTSPIIWPKPWPAPTLIIAAGKGLLPTTRDQKQTAIKARDIARQLNTTSVACWHPRMRHQWNNQDPVLYAQTARQWFEHQTVPPGFQEFG